MKRDAAPPSLDTRITRRDFIGATLLGAGATLLHAPSPASAQTLGPQWTGYAGVGDYRYSNGNTAEVVASAHKVRDGAHAGDLSDVIDTGEAYDAVIVGGGFAGLAALYEFQQRKPRGKCLLLDNHPIFGGYAKANEFDVDGYRLAAPQASCDFAAPGPGSANSDWQELWRELGLPDRFTFAPRQGGNPAIEFPKATASAMYFAEQTATVGYYFENDREQGRGVWVNDIWDDDLKRAPWPDALKKDLLALRDRKTRYQDDESEPAWLDSMSYADFVTDVMGLSSEALAYFTPVLHILGSPQVSAYAARLYPGVGRFAGRTPFAADAADRFMSFPGGNAVIARHLVKAVFPRAIEGPRTFEAIANNRVSLAIVDRQGSSCRMRLSATVVRVRHDADAARSTHVDVVYEKGGRLYRVRAQGAMLGTGSWVSKRIVTDLPGEYRAAMEQFLYAPTLIVNVALRNWRFLDRLGISAARWFDGFGFYSTLIQPMVIGRRQAPFHPDKPIVMTFYVPIQFPELPLIAQGTAGRARLYGTSYADYERQILTQMQRMFGSAGFNARRDVAGIVLNRWGHARMVPPPGFYFGRHGAPSPLQVLRRSFGRIAFGNAELAGAQSWTGAVAEGRRAITQMLTVI